MHEEQLVALIAELIASRQPAQGVILGPGDDCAVLRAEKPLAISSDMLLDKVHFRTEYMSYRQIGSRAMVANLSDLAAMGAEPAYGLLALGLPGIPAENMVRQLLGGMLDTASQYGLSLVGGDTVKSQVLTISLTVMGRLNSRPLRRSQAMAGHELWVTGPLGLSGAGLFVLLNRLNKGGRWDDLAQAHISPIPRLRAGQIMAAQNLEGAVMDISDGLATDLARLAVASGVGAVIEEDKIQFTSSMLSLGQEFGKNPLHWALCGGEDFELLFTCSARQGQELMPRLRQSGLQPVRIGRIIDKPGVYLQDKTGNLQDVAFKGYDHFKN